MRNAALKVVVIGGGIKGLTAAYRLHRAAYAGHLPLQVMLLEASGSVKVFVCM